MVNFFLTQDQSPLSPPLPLSSERSMRSTRETHITDEGDRISAQDEDMKLILEQLQKIFEQSSQARMKSLVVINRPGVARAVLQTPLSLID